MTKEVTVILSDIEYNILKNLKIVEGDAGERLRKLLRLYISTVPELKPSEYALKRVENKEVIEEILRGVWAAYEITDNPIQEWKEERINKLVQQLVEVNALVKIGENQYIPTNKFRSLFKTLLHDIAIENKNMDEYTAACIATIQLLMEFGVGSLNKEAIRDGTILINEGWMFVYSTAMKRAREFMKKKKKYIEKA